jgi:ubiquinone/menaquinone biosynthesis C-methylase UbiE
MESVASYVDPTIKPEDRWFNTPDVWTLCRGGGNGPAHPSQLYAIKQYVRPQMSFLDVGCGSGTTLEALLASDEFGRRTSDGERTLALDYKGVDFTPKNVTWCQEKWPAYRFEVQDARCLQEPAHSWDVVYSRHVVDHLPNFEIGLDEQCRVAATLVIIVLWRPLVGTKKHIIRHIAVGKKIYPDEFMNDYSRRRVLQAIQRKQKNSWHLIELAEGVGKEVKGLDTVIVLKRVIG